MNRELYSKEVEIYLFIQANYLQFALDRRGSAYKPAWIEVLESYHCHNCRA